MLSSNPAIDRAYNVRATVGDDVFAAMMARYRSESEAAVAGLSGVRDVVYDAVSGQVLDVWAGGSPVELRPAFVFIHGGYWRMLSRADSAFMARSLAADAIATVVVEYDLAPRVSLEEIVRQVRAAVAWVFHHGAEYGLDRNRIVVGGSSAGGHLTAMTLLDDWQRRFDLPPDAVAAVMPFSGLFDLEPLVHSYVNEWLGLDPVRARALSPALHLPDRGLPARFVVAAHDGAGFLQQSRDLDRSWSTRFGTPSQLMVIPDRQHFDVVLDLADPGSQVTRTLVELCHSRP